MTFEAIVSHRTASSVVFRLVGSFSEVWLPRAEASEDLPVGAAVRITCELREGERKSDVKPLEQWEVEVMAAFDPANLPRSLAEEGA